MSPFTRMASAELPMTSPSGYLIIPLENLNWPQMDWGQGPQEPGQEHHVNVVQGTS